MRRLTLNNSGFSMIELMIAILIVGILAQFAALQINGVLSRARDNVRRETLRRLQSALEAYHDDKGIYPDCGDYYCSSEPGDQWYKGPNWIPGLVPNYLNKLPRDPLGGQSANCAPTDYNAYIYVMGDNGHNYKVVSHCASESIGYPTKDPFFDPTRPTWAWQVTNDENVTGEW